MPSAQDHLIPRDEPTNAAIRFLRLDVPRQGQSAGADFTFGMFDDNSNKVGEYTIAIGPMGSIDSMLADAHLQMAGVLRQWLDHLDIQRQAYESRRLAPAAQPHTET